MSQVDELRAAGFSEDEIAADQHETMREAGFSDHEIEQDLTGLKNPRAIPEPLIKRILPAFTEGASAGWGEAPFGITPEDKSKLTLGLDFKLPAVLRVGEAAVEGLFRGVNAALMGTGAVIGEHMEAMNPNEAERGRARRDWAQMVNIAAILGGAESPMVRRGQTIGHLPGPQDFTDAAKHIDPAKYKPELRQLLTTLYEDHGLHPSEVAADAAEKPGVARDLAEGRKPAEYVGQKTAEPEPELAPGMVRMYHGGDPEGLGPLWFSSDRKYAEGWSQGRGLWYVDLPEDHPAIVPDYPEQGIKQGFTFNRELPADIADQRKSLRTAPKPEPLRSELARTGDRVIDAILEHPITKKNIDRPIVDRTFDVPYSASGSTPLDDPRVFIDRKFPREMEVRGKKFDPADPFTIHENVEQTAMDLFIKGGMDKDTAYKVAHYEFAEKAEGAWYKAKGIDQAAAEEAYRPYLDAIQHDHPANPPPDMYTKPYPHDDVAAAQAEPTEVMKPTAGEIARGRSIVSRYNDSVSPEAIRNTHYAENSGWPVPAVSDAERGVPAGAAGGGFGAEPPGGGFTWYGDVLPPQGELGGPERPTGQVAQRAPLWYTYDDSPAWRKTANNALKWWQRNFQPESISDKALMADPLFAEFKSLDRMGRDRVIAQAEGERVYWRGKSDQERLDFLLAIEDKKAPPSPYETKVLPSGAVMTTVKKGEAADLGRRATRFRALLDWAVDQERKAGIDTGYLEDYVPRWYERPLEWQSTNAGAIQGGTPFFMKERYFAGLREALASGLRLADTSPESLLTRRLLASVDAVERMNLLGRLKEMGLAREAEGAPPELGRQGWSTIGAPNRKNWLLAPDIQPLWKNAVEAKGLWAAENAAGSVFRGWMALKNTWVPLKLALSVFHPLHVLHINWNNGMALGWKEFAATVTGHGGSLDRALQYAVEGFTGPVKAAVGMKHEGRLAREAWTLPEGMRTPEQADAVRLMNEGGFVPQLAEEIKISGKESLGKAWEDSQYWKVLPLGIRRGIEKMQAPVFEQWIPNLKAAAYLNEAQSFLARNPDLLTNDALRKVGLRTIGKSVDNRFGEMFYGNVFWNRYVKDAGIGSFLSLGWNLGFVREAGGALIHPIARGTRKLAGSGDTEAQAVVHAAQNKAAYTMSYVGTAMLINGMMSYALSGESPEGWDWVFPRIGRNNPDGTPHRLTNMFYTREFPMAKKHIEERDSVTAGLGDMLWSKTMFQPFVEMWQNRNYYGSEIWSETAPAYLRGWQMLKHVFGEQLNPITISGAKRVLDQGGALWEIGMSFLGFGPAPGYVEKTPIQNRITRMFQDHVLPKVRVEEAGEQSKERGDIRTELLMAKQRGDKPGMQEAAQKWFKAGGSMQGLSNIMLQLGTDVTQFRSLPDQDQQAIMERASPEEQARYRPFLKTHIASRVADMMVGAQKARNGGDEAQATAIELKMRQAINDATRDGHITNASAFRRSVAQQVRARYSPELSAILQLPKKLRGQYAPIQ